MCFTRITTQSLITLFFYYLTVLLLRSSYLVRFSASQHKFMMKMRQWQSTLNRNRSAGTRDVQIERAETSNGIEVSHPNAPELVTHSNGTFYGKKL